MTIDDPYHSADVHGPYETYELDTLPLEGGDTLRVIDDVHGHASLFNLVPTYAEQIDRALRDLLAS